MKKLILVLAAAAGIGMANAAAVTWAAGKLYGPTGADDGSMGSTLITKTDGAWTVTLQVFADAAGNTLLQSDSFSFNVASGTATYANSKKSALNGTVATDLTYGAKAANANFSGLADETGYYYKLLVHGETDTYTADKESAITAFTTASAGGVAAINSNAGSKLGTAWTGGAWTTTPTSSGVPEPTSGLLLLVGAGMLALRRKQK